MSGLNGMKEICRHIQRSEPTVLDLIYTESFPARKVKGCWISDTELIDQWRKEKITNGSLPARAVNKKNKK